MSIRLKTAIPGPNSLALMRRREAAVPRGPFHATPVFISRAKGAIVEDVDGNQFIDFAAGIGVANTGHCNDAVLQALQAQQEQSLHLSFNVTPYESYIQVCELLNERTPGKYAKKTFLANSGAEAVENAVKIARAHTKRQAVISFEHGFHGRTYMAMTMTSKGLYKQGFGPYNPEVYPAAFPYVYRWRGGGDIDQVAESCFKEFEHLLTVKLTPSHVAAVIFEPVLGEGGFLPMPRLFAQKLREFCSTHGIVLIADEIQSGFGRTGTLFACEHLGIEPDLITTAKGLAGGTVLSAVTGRAEMMDAPVVGAIGGTFGGNPLGCAAALAVFSQIDALLPKAKILGEVLATRLSGWQQRYPRIGDVRGLGPMLGMELVKDRASKTPDPDGTKKLARYCYEHGVIVMTSGSYGNVLRFLMPLVIDHSDLEEGLAVVEAGLRSLG